jgi:hypothetical protein
MKRTHRRVLHSLAAAGLFLGMTGVASAQSCKDMGDCFKQKGTKRTEVMNLSTKLRECLKTNPNANPTTRSAMPNSYLTIIGDRDKQEQAALKGLKSDAASNKRREDIYRESLNTFAQAAADAQNNIKEWCKVAAAKPATTTTTPAAKPATTTTTPAAKPATTTTTPAAKPATTAAAAGTVTVVKALYGVNCKAKNPDITAKVAAACKGATCSYKIDAFGATGDPAPNCAKDLTVEYRCSASGATKKTSLPAEAHGKTVTLSCTSG